MKNLPRRESKLASPSKQSQNNLLTRAIETNSDGIISSCDLPKSRAGVGTLPTISSPPYQAPHIKPPIASPLQYQDPISGHPFQYETADLPYQAPTYDIKPFELNCQNEPPTYDNKLFELNLRYRKYQNSQPTISGHDQRYQAHRIRFSK